MPKTITGYITLESDPSHAVTFRTHRDPSGAIDIEFDYRHTGQHQTQHVTPGSELYHCITRLFDGLLADRADADATPRLYAIS